MDLKMAAAVASDVGEVAAFCRERGICRSTFYKWRARFESEGLDGLKDRSRAHASNPNQTPLEIEDLLIRVRKELEDDGRDAGPQSVLWELELRGHEGWLPARATVARIFDRRGHVVRSPNKRPRSSCVRFVAARPNEMWQADWTQWSLNRDRPAAIAGVLDDHSRYLAALRAGHGHATIALTWNSFEAAVAECGLPFSSLTDNGSVYANASHRGAPNTYQDNLRALGVHPITSTPHHPQTCGKIERFWQTLKKWLAVRPVARSLPELQRQLDQFRDFYNYDRPHRALNGHSPAFVFDATPVARPATRPLPAPVEVLTIRVQDNGRLDLSGTYRLGVGKQWAGRPVTVIRDGLHVAVFGDNKLIRELTIDPTHRYQPQAH